jgi:hypothetical protein
MHIADGTTEVRHEHSKVLYSYWNTLRRDRAAPERTEIEPVEIRQILGDTFILEVSPRLRVISFRLAGTRLCGAYGRELKGLGFLALWSEEDNFEVAKAVARVYRDYQPAVLSYRAKSASGNEIEFEMLLLPLAPAPDGNSRILGVASPRSSPYWLGAQPVQSNHLFAVRFPNPKTAAPPLAPLPAPVNMPASSDGATGGRRVAHLTVLNGGRA